MSASKPHSRRAEILTELGADPRAIADRVLDLEEQLEAAPTEREMRCLARVIDGGLYPLEGDFTDIINEAFAALRRIMPLLDGSNPATERERLEALGHRTWGGSVGPYGPEDSSPASEPESA